VKLLIDTDERTIIEEADGRRRVLPLYSRESFELLSRQWLKVGWNEKYVYTFTWLGRPIIQLPEDLVRAQEAVFKVQPDAIIETGIAHGGSLVLYASLCKAMGRGRVIGVDLEIRPHNRKAIEAHFLSPLITLIEGDSVNPATFAKVRELLRPGDRVLVFLDSCHSRRHVEAELEAYHGLVTPGSYIVATDGSMRDLYDVPRGKAEWKDDNPAAAAAGFAARHPEFALETPPWPFNESALRENVTHWPGAWLRRK
jgi:cephalosporin hydroxylase